MPVAIDQAALTHTTVFVNGGQRGLQIEIDPNDAALAAGASDARADGVTHLVIPGCASRAQPESMTRTVSCDD